MPSEIFSLSRGEVNILRNAGGRVTPDTFRSLSIMGTLMPIGLVVVMHHSDCGGLNTTDQEVREKLQERAPEHKHEVEGTWFGTFRDVGLEESVKVDVQAVREWVFLPKEAKVVGYMFEVETGRVREVIGLGAEEARL
jgi:carbonic anhydrase